MNIITVSNQKGGVAKTTTSVNLAASLAASGRSTLLIDLDPQGNASSSCGVRVKEGEPSVYEALMDDLVPSIQAFDQFSGLSLLPSGPDLSAAELELFESKHRESSLKMLISRIVPERFQYIIIDCPPSLGLLTINALVAARWVLIPVQAEYFALEGLSRMIQTMRRIQQNHNPRLELLGILATLYDARTNLSSQVLEELRRFYPDKVFQTYITRSVRLSESPSFGKPIRYYDPRSAGALQYQSLCEEVLDVCEKHAEKARTGARS